MEEYSGFKSAAEKWGTPISSKGKDVYYATVTVDAKDFPYLEALKVGDECELKVMIKKSSHRISDDMNTKGTQNKISFEIHKIAEPKKKFTVQKKRKFKVKND